MLAYTTTVTRATRGRCRRAALLSWQRRMPRYHLCMHSTGNLAVGERAFPRNLLHDVLAGRMAKGVATGKQALRGRLAGHWRPVCQVVSICCPSGTAIMHAQAIQEYNAITRLIYTSVRASPAQLARMPIRQMAFVGWFQLTKCSWYRTARTHSSTPNAALVLPRRLRAGQCSLDLAVLGS